ncbi:MAG: hypothetical protein AAFY39_02685 [Pseudomonadota bacterium]
MTTTAEIVTFRLNSGATHIQFLDAMQQMQPLVDRHGGMLGRTLSCDNEGVWTDHVLWESLDAAQALAAAFMTAPETEAARALIDPNTVQMRHAAVHLQQE